MQLNKLRKNDDHINFFRICKPLFIIACIEERRYRMTLVKAKAVIKEKRKRRNCT